ncbi:hypothetical protein [Halorubrum sp. SD626R]|uniref:hypothetical protein n=1 Tax=Halorubrum sp. SD626R TaxID=1419722 RepID=UPI000ADC0B49|nr:hypothetical protein [Halorubrum sp. SD626R]
MTDSDRDRRRDRGARDRSPGARATRSRSLATAVGALVFVGSVVPVPAAGASGSADGAVGVIDGAVDIVAVALPAGVGLTAPFHLLGYAVLAALLVPGTAREPRAVAAVAAAAVATAFGFGIELVQAPIPWRSFAWSDAALNAVGAAGGAAIAGTVDPVLGGSGVDASDRAP